MHHFVNALKDEEDPVEMGLISGVFIAGCCWISSWIHGRFPWSWISREFGIGGFCSSLFDLGALDRVDNV